MKDYQRLTKRDWHDAKFSIIDAVKIRAVLHRLWELENTIESGEFCDRDDLIDRLMTAKDMSTLTDKEIEFFIKHNEKVRKETAREIFLWLAENQDYFTGNIEITCGDYMEKRKEYGVELFGNSDKWEDEE